MELELDRRCGELPKVNRQKLGIVQAFLHDTEPALLHAISVVAMQNAESRLAIGRGLTTR